MAQAECFVSTPLLPQRVKSGSVSGFALLSLRSRNHARSAFHTASSSLCLSHNVLFHHGKKDAFDGYHFCDKAKKSDKILK
jgi:hypothetical protein